MTASHHPNYKRIYVTLLVLLVISVAGPFIGIKWVTLITAFGIALIKANIVVQNFMHLRWERPLMKWVLSASLLLMGLFYFGVAADIMRHRGRNWTNDAALAATERGIPGERHITGGPDSLYLHWVVADNVKQAPPAGAPAAFSASAAYTTTCATCHGATGAGDGPAAAALNPKPANFTAAAFWSQRTDAAVLRAIREGGAAVGRSAVMPAWGHLYDETQARAIVDHLKTLRRP